ncbi:MAG: hydrogenase iron-sulfur subunit [Deltaproteobacteria bacterium]|nr:hydrogenase iron-sulfur subunit [Deltaproteobacteria bacterium]
MTPFEPELTGFTCSYCAYMSGDTAGALRIQYPANVKVVRLPCTGKTDPRYLLAAFEEGADGVYVIACPIGNCHHRRGNERARARVTRMKKLLDRIGLGGERLEIYFLSGGMGESFAIAAREMTERVRRLGPTPLKNRVPSSACRASKADPVGPAQEDNRP